MKPFMLITFLIIFLILPYLITQMVLRSNEFTWVRKSQDGVFSIDDWNRGIFETPFDNSSSSTTYEFAKPPWDVGDFFEIEWRIQARSMGMSGETARLRQGIICPNGRIEIQAQISTSENIEGTSCHYYVTYHASNGSLSGLEPRDPRTVYDNAVVFNGSFSYQSGAPPPLLILIRFSRADSNTVFTSVYWRLETGSFNIFERSFSADWSQVSWQVDIKEKSDWGLGGACSVRLVSYSDSSSISRS